MNLEDQICSYELSIKLKELRVNQCSLVYWIKVPHIINVLEDGTKVIGEYRFELGNCNSYNILENDYYSAFTVAELGKMLPDSLCCGADHPNLFIAYGTQIENQWTIGYSTFEKAITSFYTEENEANARAKMLIYLIENHLIEAQNVGG